MSIREQVRLRLIGTGADPWKDNVLELEGTRTSEDLPSPIATGQASSRPFVIVRLGPQTPGAYWGNLGDSIDVWPYSEDQTWQDLDLLCGLVLLRLDKQIIQDTDGVTYQLQYAGVGTQDTPVAEWDAYTRPLRFDSVKLAWLIPTHPLATAFQDWTKKTFPEVLTDPSTWVPSATAPGIYWRVSDVPRVRNAEDHFNIWLDLMRASLVGHVISPDPTTILSYLTRLAAMLPRATIHYGNTILAGIDVGRADPDADSHTDGQLTVEVRYGALNGNIWAGLPGYPNQPWIPVDPEHPWVPLDPSLLIPIHRAEIRDGVVVGVSPEPQVNP